MRRNKPSFWIMLLMTMSLMVGVGAKAQQAQADTSVAQVELVGELPSTNPDPNPAWSSHAANPYRLSAANRQCCSTLVRGHWG